MTGHYTMLEFTPYSNNRKIYFLPQYPGAH
jgi:hypothetical protein